MRVIEVDWMEEWLRLVGEEGGAESVAQSFSITIIILSGDC